MNTAIKKSWTVESVDQYGDISDCLYFDSMAEAETFMSLAGPEYKCRFEFAEVCHVVQLDQHGKPIDEISREYRYL